MHYMEKLSCEEQNAIQELKNRVKDELTSPGRLDDELYYRFLKGRGFDVDKAESLLRKHILWRKVYQVDNILETFKPNEVFVKYIEPSLVGFDKDGDIVKYYKCGPLNNTEIMKCMKLHEYMKNWIWCLEKNMSLIIQRSKKTGRMTTLSVIIDLDGLKLANATSRISVDVCLHFVQILKNNYRESLKSVYVINAPFYYVYIYKIIRAVVSHALIRKMHNFGYDGWKEKLLEVIDADVLPAFLGGERTDHDGDPYCRSFIILPGKIPESYYLSEEERHFRDPSEVTNIVIHAGEKKEISVPVKEDGSWIHWKFRVKIKTIHFGLFFEESETVMKEIIPLHEFDTSDGTEEYSYRCLSKGKYIIIFDNSCSKFTSKEVKYVLSVELPPV